MGIKDVAFNGVNYKIDCPDHDSEKFDFLIDRILRKINDLLHATGGNRCKNDLLLLLIAIKQQDELMNIQESNALLDEKILCLYEKINKIVEKDINIDC